jgi:hypothetical protein
MPLGLKERGNCGYTPEVAVLEGELDSSLAAAGVGMHWDQREDMAEVPEAFARHKHSPEGGHYMHWDRHKADPGMDSEEESAEVAPHHMQWVPPDKHYNPVVHSRQDSSHTWRYGNPPR